MTTSFSRGSSTWRFFKLCWRAPLILITCAGIRTTNLEPISQAQPRFFSSEIPIYERRKPHHQPRRTGPAAKEIQRYQTRHQQRACGDSGGRGNVATPARLRGETSQHGADQGAGNSFQLAGIYRPPERESRRQTRGRGRAEVAVTRLRPGLL